MNSRRFVKTVLAGTVTILVIAGGLTALIDPFFHFHKPLKNQMCIRDRCNNVRYIPALFFMIFCTFS